MIYLKIVKKEKFVFSGEDRLKEGMYFVLLSNNRLFDIIITEQKFSFNTSIENMYEQMEFKNSKENPPFYNYINYMSKLKSKTSPLVEKLNSVDNKEKEQLQEELHKINEEVKKFTKKHNFYGDRKNTDMWSLKRDNRNTYEHPTQKPVELIERAIINSSLQEQTVLDLFLGSGSTLIACEKTKRKCLGFELDPKYVDVIIQRWENFTGKKAEKINGKTL